MSVLQPARVVPGDTDISDDKVREATGHGWQAWFRLMDALEKDAKDAGERPDHASRAKALGEAHQELDGWWVQMITVQYERERGHRQVGQSSRGDYQVSATKTLAIHIDEAWRRLMQRPFVGSGPWREGATWEGKGGKVEVRVVKPPTMLRFFWHDEAGRSTVIAALTEKENRTTITFQVEGLQDADARERERVRWSQALAVLARG